MSDHKVPRIKVGIALRIDQRDALREMATVERHGNVSLIVQRAIDRELGLVDKPTESDSEKARAAA